VTDATWVAGASLFSGRPDPVWAMGDAAAREIIRVWETLPVVTTPAVLPPALGYKGVFLRDPDGHEWRAFHGIVETDLHGARNARADEQRRFENAILASAPPDRVPKNLIG
jgi:hypothetical protein